MPNPTDSPFLLAHASALSRRLRRPPPARAEERRERVVPHGMSFEEWMRSPRRSEDIARAADSGMPLD